MTIPYSSWSEKVYLKMSLWGYGEYWNTKIDKDTPKSPCQEILSILEYA